MSRYPLFDRARIELRSLSERGHELVPSAVWRLDAPAVPYEHADLSLLSKAIVRARQANRPVVWMMGAHPIKLGLSRYIIDLIQRRLVTHVATNGAGIIHDFELAWGRGTSEDVARWIRAGQFGLWSETSRLNEIISEAARRGEGLGEAVGRVICQEKFPHRELSICAAGYQYGVPVTSHVSVGSDIIHAHANCDGAALGAATHTDFLMFAHQIERLDGGVYLNVGTAVTGPEVYLKALAMARNVARQRQESIRHFTTAVFDLVELPHNFRDGPPGKNHAQYYYRPWKTILVRTVADGGKSYYFCGDHQQTIPSVWRHVVGLAQTPQQRAA